MEELMQIGHFPGQQFEEVLILLLQSFGVNEYNNDIEKLGPRYDKCLNNNGKYGQKVGLDPVFL